MQRVVLKSVLYVLVCSWVMAFGLVHAAVEFVTQGSGWKGYAAAALGITALFALMLIDKVRSISFTAPPKVPMMSPCWLRGGKPPDESITR